MKYFESIDKFIRIRVFTKAQLSPVLAQCKAKSKARYVEFVVAVTIPDFLETLKPAIQAQYGPEYHEDVLVSLYQTCVDVNPNLEVHQVGIPIYAEAQTGPDGEIPDDIFDPPKFKPVSPNLAKRALRKRVVGQDDAIDAFVRFWRRAFVGLRDPKRPVGSMMFIGSTGVGKTELAKAIADVAFDGELIRIDCSEYAERHEYAKLIGSPPGYVGHGDGGYLTKALEESPRSVVLFDEIEKADDRIYNLLLQAIDEGRLTDSGGTTSDLSKAFIVFTSNVGTAEIESMRDRAGFSRDLVRSIDHGQREHATLEALEDHFPLEFLNRLDDVVVFREFEPADVLCVVGIFVDRLRVRLEGLGHGLEVTSPARVQISRKSFDPKWGAREVARVVRDLVEDPIANILALDDLKKGVKFQVFTKSGEIGVRREWL